MYAPYLDRTDSMDRVMKRVKSLWTVAKNKYNIHEQHDFKLALVNPENILRVTHCNILSAPTVLVRTGVKPVVLLRLNKQELENNISLFLDGVIPHDIAHVVCVFRPNEGHSHRHDIGWRDVYSSLGGVECAL